MVGNEALIGIDWGTTNRRVYLIDADGSLADHFCDDRGVLTLNGSDYAREIDSLRDRFGARRVIAAGMIGSSRGWHEAPYVNAPASLNDLAAAMIEVLPQTWIVPGVALRSGGRADVMRGEEVQVLGSISRRLAQQEPLFCQPGTHNKWIKVKDGCIVDFTTAMTGELFAHLRMQGILSGMLDGTVSDDDAFRDGVRRGSKADLAVALFEVRASVLLGCRAASDAASFASGILIGADVGARDDLAGSEVVLLASGPLADLYATAINMCGAEVRKIDSRDAFVGGIEALRMHLQ